MSNADEANRKLLEAAAEQKGQAEAQPVRKPKDRAYKANRAFDEARPKKSEEDRTSSK